MLLLIKKKKKQSFIMQKFGNFWTTIYYIKILLKHSFNQRVKKVMSDRPRLGLVDFALRLVNSVVNCPIKLAACAVA